MDCTVCSHKTIHNLKNNNSTTRQKNTLSRRHDDNSNSVERHDNKTNDRTTTTLPLCRSTKDDKVCTTTTRIASNDTRKIPSHDDNITFVPVNEGERSVEDDDSNSVKHTGQQDNRTTTAKRQRHDNCLYNR